MTSKRTIRRRRTLTVAATLVLAVALLGSACTADEATTGTGETGTTAGETVGPPVDGGTLVVGLNNESAGWNPIDDRFGAAPVLAGSAMFEPLAAFSADAEAEPWLATGWEPNADFTSWTVSLRDDVTFHNGEPFDAASVKLNIDSYTANPLSGLVLKTLIEQTTVVDEHTVRVDLLSPWAAFPTSFLAGPTSFQMAPATLQPDYDASNNPVGTGPFEFVEWSPNTQLKLTKNDDYWRDGEPHLDALEFRPVVEDSSRTSALQSGTIDMMFTISAADAVMLEPDYKVFRDWDTEATLLAVNTRPTAGGQENPMANVHARRAVAHATDAEAIAALIGDDLEVPTSPFSEASPWGDPASADDYPAYDVEKAKQEVEAYKEDTGKASLDVSLIGPTDQVTLTVFAALQQQWSEAGINADVENLELSALQVRPIGGNFQISLAPLYSAPEPDQNYTFWSSSTAKGDGEFSLNFTGLVNDVTEGALKDGRATADPEARRDAYTRLVGELNREAVNIWLYFTPYSIVASDQVHGLEPAAEQTFANFWPKTWWGGVWKSP